MRARSPIWQSVLLRRLLTALALITGLAATGAPVCAAAVDAVSEQTLAAASSSPGEGQLVAECVMLLRLDPARQLPTLICDMTSTFAVVAIPSVRTGSDRSLQ